MIDLVIFLKIVNKIEDGKYYLYKYMVLTPVNIRYEPNLRDIIIRLFKKILSLEFPLSAFY